jgi:Flp pilus assembly protein TadB
MKKLIQLTLCLGLLALASCKEKNSSGDASSNQQQEELKHWQIRAEDEIQKRELAESESLTNASRAQTLEKAVIVTGVAALAFLVIGGAIGSTAKKDALNS